MIDNIELFEYSIKSKEPYIDTYYDKNSCPIITDSPQNLNELMRANAYIQENISTYKIAKQANQKQMLDIALTNIIEALETKDINFSEFTSYWATKDVSYSIYKKTLKTKELRYEFLKGIIDSFIEERHSIYQNHGYSFSSLQAIKDSKSHKSNGNAGYLKVCNLFNKAGLTHLSGSNVENFQKTDNIYICPDGRDRNLFKTILKEFDIKFEWSGNHENKQTDFLFKINNRIYIMEHKHMKESGGGQDKQMSEIINFVSYYDKDVSYVSFLDGIYFNLLACDGIDSGKVYEQRRSIKQNLTKQKQNYFVNTQGFIKLLEQAGI